jgi:hypothetical protein
LAHLRFFNPASFSQGSFCFQAGILEDVDVIDGKGNNKYKFTPRVLGLFDLKNFPKDPKQEWRV